MGILVKDRSPLVSFILTEYGKQQLAKGKLTFDYYAFGDSDIDYRSADINSLTLKPSSLVSDLKYLLYKKDNSGFYPITEANVETTDVINEHNHTFENFTNNNKIIDINPKFIGVCGSIVKAETPYILNVKFDNPIVKDDIKPLDFITIFLTDEFQYVEDGSFDIYHCQIENILVTDQKATIYLKQPINLEIQEYRFFITTSNFLFYDNQTWNQVFCGGDQLPNIEKRFDGIRSYFELRDGLLIYNHDQLNTNDFNEAATASASLYAPTIMWDRCPVARVGLNLHTTNNVNELKSPVNQQFKLGKVDLVDDYNNKIGWYSPQQRVFFIDDIELATTMAGKNSRNWTLPGIEFEYIPSNGNGLFNKTNDDLYVTYMFRGGVHNNTAHCRKILYIPNKKGDYQINLDFSQFQLPSISDPSRRIKEVVILYQYVPAGGKINPNTWLEISMLKSENLTIDNIRGKYGLNIQHINRGIPHQTDQVTNLDEQLFLGNVKYKTQSKRYITTFKFISDLNKTLYTSNPTYTNDKDVRVSEVAVYDQAYKVVAYAKVSHSIRWRADVVFTIKTQMAF